VAEIGGALGVDKLALGNVGKLGRTYLLTLKLIDVNRARVEGRYTETIEAEADALIAAVRKGVPRIFSAVLATPAPAPARDPSPTAAAAAPGSPHLLRRHRDRHGDMGVGRF
jgi:hypothetical protein